MNSPQIQLPPGQKRSHSLLIGVWLAGFLVTYLSFFICPIFFNSAHVMQFFKTVSAIDPIGIDLKHVLLCSEAALKHAPIMDYINVNPPLASLLFMPLLSMDFFLAYKIMTVVTIVSFITMTFLLPLQSSKSKLVTPLLVFLLVTGLYSYGFQFELERGQFHVLAVFLSFLAIWIFHYYPRWRFLAYVLFTISVQLKTYPAIFALMLISDWRDWKRNFARLFLLAAANVALLFVLGPEFCAAFVQVARTQSADPVLSPATHSIRAFVMLASQYLSDQGWPWLSQHSTLVQSILLAMVAACVIVLLLAAYRENKGGINPYLLLTCTLCAMLIPPQSHDYKLSILAAPVAVLFTNERFADGFDHLFPRVVAIVLIFIFSVLYTSTTYPSINKPTLLKCNCPALLLMLLAITLLSLLSKPRAESQAR